MGKVAWAVSLSNGENCYEGKGKYETVPGELSPWNRLMKYIAEEDLKITSLSLVTDDGRTFRVPSAGNAPKFPMFENAEKPVDYRFFHALTAVVGDKGEQFHYVVIEAVYPDRRLQMWVDHDNPRNAWCLTI